MPLTQHPAWPFVLLTALAMVAIATLYGLHDQVGILPDVLVGLLAGAFGVTTPGARPQPSVQLPPPPAPLRPPAVTEPAGPAS